MEQYNQIKVLGKGSFGAAWLVQRKKDGANFVAKEVRLTGMKPQEKESAKNEISMLRTLNHPNITKYIDHFEHKGSLFIVMEYADGGDLYAKIKGRRGVRFTEREILHFFGQLCLALLHLHDKRILHRDLKSQNVFLTSDGVVKLGDFGISTVLRNTYELKRTVCGTPYYFSPELCQNKPYNNKSDVWALGCILYELTTLTHAFDGTNLKSLVTKILKGVYPPIHSSYSPDLARLVSSLLKIDPSQRPNVQQIVSLEYVRSSLVDLRQEVKKAKEDGRGLVDPREQERQKAEAQKKLEDDAVLREKRAVDAKVHAEQREKEKQARMDALRAQMELQQREHEEKLRRVREKDKADQEQAAQRRENEKKQLEAKKQQQEQRAVIDAKVQRQREEEWERNMRAHQEEVRRRQEMQALLAQNNNRESPVLRNVAGGIGGGDYDAQEAARIYREMRRETAINKMRAAENNAPAQVARPLGQLTPLSPPVGGGKPQGWSPVQSPVAVKTPLSKDEMEEARRVAYWQGRHEAENNKRRILGLEPLPPQPIPPAPQQQQQPSPSPHNVPVKRVESAQRKSPPAVPVQMNAYPNMEAAVARRSPPALVVVQPPIAQPAVDAVARRSPPVASPIQVPSQPSAMSPVAQPRVVVAESSDDEDEGYHRFLNMDAVAGANTATPQRQDDLKCIENILSQLDDDAGKRAGNGGDDDFDDPNCQDSDPSHFLLEGQTLVLPNCRSDNPLMSRIESLRLFLEVSLGDQLFIGAYRIMDDDSPDDDDDPVERVYAILPAPLHKYVPLISQLLVCEGIFNRGS